MGVRFEELDWRPTPMGDICLRRRWDATVGKDVYEIKLDDDFLMSSLFTAAEEEIARLALAQAPPAPNGHDVVVGGLGLGHTARTVLEHSEVASLLVVEALGEVIEWNERGLVPEGREVAADPRTRLVHGDFFALADAPEGFDAKQPGRRFHAVIVDIDHSPRHLLNPGHAGFYTPEGVRRLAAHLHPDGVFALWSDDPPDADYTEVLSGVFADVRTEVVRFPSPFHEQEGTNTVYLASTPAAPARAD